MRLYIKEKNVSKYVLDVVNFNIKNSICEPCVVYEIVEISGQDKISRCRPLDIGDKISRESILIL